MYVYIYIYILSIHVHTHDYICIYWSNRTPKFLILTLRIGCSGVARESNLAPRLQALSSHCKA